MVCLKKYLSVFLSCLLICAVFSACSGGEAGERSDDSEGLKIVTTVFPIYDWVRNITGSDNVVYLDESGIDFHSFEPTANDILSLSSADVFIYIGGSSDKWVDGAVASADNPDLTLLPLISVTGLLEEETVEGMETDEDGEADGTEYDEHIWLSLKKARQLVAAICETLCEKDPSNKEKYTLNAESYSEKLKELDEKYASAVSSASRNTLLFADRFPFRYLTEDYSLEYYAAFPGCSAESEASFETMSFLIDKTKELSLPYIIVLEGSDGKIAKTVSEESGAGILTMNSCQSVTSEDAAAGMTYISVMENNLTVLTEALG